MKNYLTGILYLLYRHEKLVSFFYPIIMALRQENNYRLQDKQIVIQTLACEELLRFPASEFLVEAEKLLKAVNEKDGVFGVPKLEVFMNNIYSHSLNAKSSDKTGIIIILHDRRTKINSEKGFCIKSFVGANSTLFNAGLDTNFIYEVIPPEGVALDCDTFNAETYCTNGKIAKLKNELNCKIEFESVQSKCLDQNLRTIDGDLPLLISHLLLIRYLKGESTIKRCTEILTEQNPLDFDIENHGSVYEYKVKRFLHDCALGMVPEKPWQGIYDATGGQIIVKEDGQVVCYHIYEQNRFLNYLYNSTKFEGASTSEDENSPGHPRQKVAGKTLKPFFYGWLYEENGKLYFKLNLQVRFK